MLYAICFITFSCTKYLHSFDKNGALNQKESQEVKKCIKPHKALLKKKGLEILKNKKDGLFYIKKKGNRYATCVYIDDCDFKFIVNPDSTYINQNKLDKSIIYIFTDLYTGKVKEIRRSSNVFSATGRMSPYAYFDDEGKLIETGMSIYIFKIDSISDKVNRIILGF